MFTKYREFGLSLIPIRNEKGQKGKAPCFPEWSHWCETLPTEEECARWDTQYSRYGLCMGPASGLMALDIDTNDVDIINACKPSSVVKRGAKGETRFYQYNPLIPTGKIADIVDVLCNGRQTVVPPTTHPDTDVPYIWLTADTFPSFSVKDLPTLSIEEFDAYCDFIHGRFPEIETTEGGVQISGGPWVNTDPKRKCPHGSQDRLKTIVTAMIARNESPDFCVKELLRYDNENHLPVGYFSDPTRSDTGFTSHPEANAFFFYSSNLKTFLRRNKTAPRLAISGSELIEVSLDAKPTFIHQNYPEPTGLIRDVRDLIIRYSERRMPNIALGGAVALMAVICSNRYRFGQCWTNTYALNLAPTGTGKSYPYKILSMILQEETSSGLMGYGGYQSSGAFTRDLITKRERLDPLDEVSSLFAQMNGGGLWQTAIMEEQCKTWTNSNGYYSAAQYAEKEASSCFNPCISILASSTVSGIKPHINRMMVAKGLIPRFLIFKDEDYGPKGEDRLDAELLRHVVDQVNRILAVPKREAEGPRDLLNGVRYNPMDLYPTDRDALEYFQEIRDDFFKRVETEPSESIKDMLTRGKEQVMKLSTGHAAGNFREVKIQDLAWAKETFEVCLNNARLFIEEVSVDSEWEKDVQAFLNLLKTHDIVSMNLLQKRVKRLQPPRIEMLVKYLTQGGTITRSSKKSPNGKQVDGWSLIGSPL